MVKKLSRKVKPDAPITFIVVRTSNDFNSYNTRIYSEDFRAKVEDDFVTGESFLFDNLLRLTQKYKDMSIPILWEFREE